MTYVTRDVGLEAVSDLLERPPRASLAFLHSGSVAAAPVRFRFEDGRYWVAIPAGGPGPIPQTGTSATLVIDDGWYFFELRAVRVRGRLTAPAEPPRWASAETAWLEIIPAKVLAWDYGSMRVEEGDAT